VERVAGIKTELDLGGDNVWHLVDGQAFNYSDGAPVERYLTQVLSNATDLGSMSDELEGAIRDWPSEYHLTKRRAHLLRDFEFPRMSSVLEIGPGCGAITRYLGETFDRVLSIEGAPARARLARLRSRDLANVTIVCAPFDALAFDEKFDIIFCIGVLEYAEVYSRETSGAHARMLSNLHALLAPGGRLVLAIENQFGLKYFSSSSEDHTHEMFDGIEGYPRTEPTPRTFGRDELENLLAETFESSHFYFPLPDYKVPTCVVSERLAERVNLGELFGQFHSRDYLRPIRNLFDERLALGELDRNGLLPVFANSFLVVAHADEATEETEMRGLGVLYRTDRGAGWRTITRFMESTNGEIEARKELLDGSETASAGNLSLVGGVSTWQRGLSLQAEVYRRARSGRASIADVFRPTRAWFDALADRSFTRDGERYVEGKLLDALWKNSFIVDDECRFIDLEWQWHNDIPLSVMAMRAVYVFLAEYRFVDRVPRSLVRWRVSQCLREVAGIYGLSLSSDDFEHFTEIEAQLQSTMTGVTLAHTKMTVKGRLSARPGPTFRMRLERKLAVAERGLRTVGGAAKRKLRRV
jgi:SAM-dependent methyltransferase